MQSDNRPLSPHLQIYKPQWTWIPSILYRASGGALAVGSLLLVYWLIALASGPDAFATAQAVLGSVIGQIVLFGFTLALMYHLLGGIRHLVWDAGLGFEIETAERWAKLIVAGSIILTILVWIIAYAI
jgi:succinate dehydrogenase / fumarate reductase cytochrome b subunit